MCVQPAAYDRGCSSYSRTLPDPPQCTAGRWNQWWSSHCSSHSWNTGITGAPGQLKGQFTEITKKLPTEAAVKSFLWNYSVQETGSYDNSWQCVMWIMYSNRDTDCGRWCWFFFQCWEHHRWDRNQTHISKLPAVQDTTKSVLMCPWARASVSCPLQPADTLVMHHCVRVCLVIVNLFRCKPQHRHAMSPTHCPKYYICPISTALHPAGSNLNSGMVQRTKIATTDDMKSRQ